jgi:hypothetical protein
MNQAHFSYGRCEEGRSPVAQRFHPVVRFGRSNIGQTRLFARSRKITLKEDRPRNGFLGAECVANLSGGRRGPGFRPSPAASVPGGAHRGKGTSRRGRRRDGLREERGTGCGAPAGLGRPAGPGCGVAAVRRPVGWERAVPREAEGPVVRGSPAPAGPGRPEGTGRALGAGKSPARGIAVAREGACRAPAALSRPERSAAHGSRPGPSKVMKGSFMPWGEMNESFISWGGAATGSRVLAGRTSRKGRSCRGAR